MTWIGGIFSKVNMGQGELRKKLAVMMETAYPANEPSAVAYPHCISSILDDAHGKILVKVSLPVEGMTPEHVYTDYQEKLTLIYDGHLYNSESMGPKLSRAQHRANETAAESLVHLLAELPGNLEQKVRRALTDLDGDYALAASNTDQIVISRNSLGTKPLYFAENNDFSAFASNKKPLWKIGLGEVRPLRAGMLAIFDSRGIRLKEASPLDKGDINIMSMARAVDKYEQALCSAVRKRLAEMNHVRKVGVLLSGGVDSCLIAKLVHGVASGVGMEAIAYTVGLPDSPDVSFAREFARELGIKHEMKMLSIDGIEEYIPKVIEAIEDSDFVQIETGIGIYAAIDMASQDGTRVIFSGQGPDELWGGYKWYPKVLGKDGRQELCRRMWDDFTMVDIETLDRENKIAMAHGVELFFPYLDTEVVNVAMSVASELKVTSEEDYLGKHPHRQLAIKVGISEKYANREKLAIQHGTGIHGVLDEIARRNGFDPALVKDIGYKSEEITSEKMGSSARYGYRYTGKKLWQVPQHIQLFLHALAYRKGLLNKSVRDRVGYFLEKARLSSRVLV
ncbi:MAG: asparagine synthetase B [Dehalococcoidia bacterium]|nr:asparagine synthetase B [Dehalococcoidia bacterium]